MDTVNFDDRSPEAYKAETRRNWTAAPCGSLYSAQPMHSREFFEEVEAHRYRVQGWTLDAIQSLGVAGKRVLEIGYGMGTDHLALTRKGARAVGVDLTPRSAAVTRHRFQLYGLDAKVMVADAERLPFADATFDVVYSFGVVHHSPDTPKIIREVRRVLKPGGTCWISVYHRNSVFFWWSVLLVDWLWRGGYRRESLRERLSRIEYPNDNKNMVIRLYRRQEFEALFEGFSSVRSHIDHLIQDDIERIGKWIPRRVLRVLAPRFGWYVVVQATR